MDARRRRWLRAVGAGLGLMAAISASGLTARQATSLPDRLSDREFWRLSEAMSEPDGSFRSDNLLSNEMAFNNVVPALISGTRPGGVYLGVGPEQNFTYIAAIRPRMAIITDIRRGNLHLQLMYKALFELSADRAEFVSRLFVKKRPDGLGPSSTAAGIMAAYWDVSTDNEAAYDANLAAITDHLTKTRGIPLAPADLAGIARVYRAFYWYGPGITYSASTSLGPVVNARGTTYADLMGQTDANGNGLSYLASEEKFAFLKDLQRRNLVVPVVGNFSGPKALRAVGDYVRSHGATVTAFYVSNVESYLHREGSWNAFCGNVATMPIDEASVFIRPGGMSMSVSSMAFVVSSPRGGTGSVTAGQPRLVRFVTPSGMNSVGPAVVPIAGDIKACAGR